MYHVKVGNQSMYSQPNAVILLADIDCIIETAYRAEMTSQYYIDNSI